MAPLRSSFLLVLAGLFALTGHAWGEGAGKAAQGASAHVATALRGAVLSANQPLAQVQVYLQEISREGFRRVQTNRQGRYSFPSLPAGLFRIVAFKQGFVPVIQTLLRKSQDERQELRIDLIEESWEAREGEDYWTVRSRIPADILRDAQGAGFGLDPRPLSPASGIATMPGISSDQALVAIVPSDRSFHTRMQAGSGVEQLGADRGDAKWSNAEVGFQGQLGAMAIGMKGRFQQLKTGEGSSVEGPSGKTHSIALHVSNPETSTLSFSSSGGEMTGPRKGEESALVEMEHLRLSWSARAGEKGRASLIANYTEESNYHRLGRLDPLGLPGVSNTLNLEGAYSRDLTPTTSLTTGVRFRQRDGSTLSFANLSEREHALLEETIGLYGVADTEIRPWVVVEYGLFSQYRDGELSLMPRGGLVVQLNDQWTASTSISQRFEGSSRDDGILPRSFNSAFHNDNTTCQSVGAACYEVFLSHEGDDGDRFKIGAMHREYAETLRLYFNDEFFNRLESLFLVQGDDLQELSFQMVRRLSPKVLATLSSNVAEGGGGIFYATDSKAYKNEVRYLVASLDTHFQQTDTGIFLAFHHLEQALSDLHGKTGDEMEMQRLQLMLTQDLRVLADMAAKWELRVNMEVSRGATPYSLTADSEMYKKLTGGLSVSF